MPTRTYAPLEFAIILFLVFLHFSDFGDASISRFLFYWITQGACRLWCAGKGRRVVGDERVFGMARGTLYLHLSVSSDTLYT